MYFSILEHERDTITTFNLATTKRRNFRLSLVPALQKVPALFKLLASLLIIASNFYSLPHALRSFYKFYSSTISSKLKFLRVREPETQSDPDSFSNLPLEITLLILLRLDLETLSTLAQTSRHFHAIFKTNELWRLKCTYEFDPSFKLFSTSKAPYSSWSKSYLAARKILRPRTIFGKPLITRTRPTAPTLSKSSQRSLALLHHIPLTPVKLLGYALTPLNSILSTLMRPQARKLTCIHLIALDLLVTTKRVTSIWRRHVYAVCTVVASLFTAIELTSRSISTLNRSRPLFIKPIWFALLVYLNVQLNLLPYYLLSSYHSFALVIAQMLWLPVSTSSIESLNAVIGISDRVEKIWSTVRLLCEMWEFLLLEAWKVITGVY
jgi:hypothetical protein